MFLRLTSKCFCVFDMSVQRKKFQAHFLRILWWNDGSLNKMGRSSSALARFGGNVKNQQDMEGEIRQGITTFCQPSKRLKRSSLCCHILCPLESQDSVNTGFPFLQDEKYKLSFFFLYSSQPKVPNQQESMFQQLNKACAR